MKIEIDGKQVETKQGAMIIEAADDAGIHIPRFCYHKKLSIAANCRMCLVEVEKMRKPLPACATPVTEGMKVFTQSEAAKESQRIVMEFLLINHPLDCPICDQGGQCELQDQAMTYGASQSQFDEGKRVVSDDDLGALISTEMTRCIHCTRCVRFGEEIAGVRELGATGRGEHMQIGTYVQHAMSSEMSGNIIDLCPVGALTSKPFRFGARAWEMQQHASIASHDAAGSNIAIHTRGGSVMRMSPRENDSINEMWLSDRDRFSYQGLNSDERAANPQIKENGVWREVEWAVALDYVAEAMRKVIDVQGVDKVAGLISPNATLEEQYLFQKVCRGLGTANVDHRLRQIDFRSDDRAPLAPIMQRTLTSLQKINSALIVGGHLPSEQPMLNHHVRQAVMHNNASVSVINGVDVAHHFDLYEKVIVSPYDFASELCGVIQAVLSYTGQTADANIATLLQNAKVTDSHKRIAQNLQAADDSVIFTGAVARAHPHFSVISILAEYLAKITESDVVVLADGANSAGAWLTGAVSHRGPMGESLAKVGLSAAQSLKQPMSAYMLFNMEPELDGVNPAATKAMLDGADFIAAFTPYVTDYIKSYANVILPIAPFSETSGTFVNLQGDWQSFKGCVKPRDETRPGWKVLRVLGNILELPKFDYSSSSEVRDEVKALNVKLDNQNASIDLSALTAPHPKLCRFTEWPTHMVDNIVRRATALQESALGIQACVRVHPDTAAGLNLNAEDDSVLIQQNGVEVNLPLILDNTIAPNCVWLPQGFNDTGMLGESFGAIELSKATSACGQIF